MIENQPVESLPSFLTLVSQLSKRWEDDWLEKERKQGHETWAAAWLPWFRGEESAAWLLSGTALQPKLYRKRSNPKVILDLEAEMRVEFRRRGAQLITERTPVDKWEWYFLMQHYGAPTRLLDWSDAALVGLYFAVSKRGVDRDKNADADAAVYMLDPYWLNEQAFKEVSQVADEYRALGSALSDWEEAKPYLSDDEFENEELGVICPLAIDPPHFSRRFAAQRSCFTIFGRDMDGLKLVANRLDAHLVKFDVKKESIPAIKRDLRWAGISEDTIFPDLEGLGRELSYWLERHAPQDEPEVANGCDRRSRLNDGILEAAAVSPDMGSSSGGERAK
jgi:hypothetical protein